MLAQKIETLKMMVVNETDFSKPVTYFFDVLSTEPDFYTAGEESKDEIIKACFMTALESLYDQVKDNAKKKQKGKLMPITWLEEYQFAHAGAAIGNKMGMLFYFKDMDMGMGCIASSFLSSDMVYFTRFSVMVGKDPSQIHGSNKSKYKH